MQVDAVVILLLEERIGDPRFDSAEGIPQGKIIGGIFLKARHKIAADQGFRRKLRKFFQRATLAFGIFLLGHQQAEDASAKNQYRAQYHHYYVFNLTTHN